MLPRCATHQNMRPAVRMIASRFELVIFDCDALRDQITQTVSTSASARLMIGSLSTNNP
jgi:hypothetical protein